LVPQNPGGFTHPAQAEAVRQAGRHLATAGYSIEEVTPPDLTAPPMCLLEGVHPSTENAKDAGSLVRAVAVL
jgi:hypothetical protein